jgi:DNA mismatch endonuclease, patch repair protein
MTSVKRSRRSARFAGLRPSSSQSSAIASTSSIKRGTQCELRLSRRVRTLGLRFRTNVSSLPGCPDLVFDQVKVAVFADGDFWHGRQLASRLKRLAKGHNSEYWVRKIRSNVARDRRVRRQLNALGWKVLRIWESDIHADVERATSRIVRAVAAKRRRRVRTS